MTRLAIRCRPPARRGSIYVLVLGIGLILSVIAVSALTVGRLKLRMVGDESAALCADLLARSAAERALAIIDNDPSWRTRYAHGVEAESVSWGGGTMGFTLADPIDGDLSDDPADAVRVTATGRVPGAAADAVRVYGLTVLPWATAEVLASCAHGRERVTAHSWARPTLVGGPVSTDGRLDLFSTAQIDGDAECFFTTGGGTVLGELHTGVPPKALPFDAFSYYRGKARDLGEITDDLEAVVLTPAFNGLGGGTDPEGVYYFETDGRSISIAGCRLHGTLVIDAGDAMVSIDDAALMMPYRPDYPVLIVRGDLRIRIDSEEPLREDEWDVNLNPPGASYLGSIDHDLDDAYPNEIHGLVHSRGWIRVERTSRIQGVLLSEDGVNLHDEPTLVHDPSLWQNPPEGYASPRVINWTREPAN